MRVFNKTNYKRKKIFNPLKNYFPNYASIHFNSRFIKFLKNFNFLKLLFIFIKFKEIINSSQ